MNRFKVGFGTRIPNRFFPPLFVGFVVFVVFRGSLWCRLIRSLNAIERWRLAGWVKKTPNLIRFKHSEKCPIFDAIVWFSMNEFLEVYSICGTTKQQIDHSELWLQLSTPGGGSRSLFVWQHCFFFRTYDFNVFDSLFDNVLYDFTRKHVWFVSCIPVQICKPSH